MPTTTRALTPAKQDKASQRTRQVSVPLKAVALDSPGLQHAIADPFTASPIDILAVHRQYGNRAVERLIDQAVRRKPLNGDELDPKVSDAINRSRGSGSSLPAAIRGPMETAFRADFGGVRVHTDRQSDQLNRSVQAKAFTIGSDIYFRKGNYNPSSSSGQELLAHELTHVVQQSGSGNRVQGKLTLGPVGDRYEQEADRVARQVIRRENRFRRPVTQQHIARKQAADLSTPAGSVVAPMIQRKVGFEFETGVLSYKPGLIWGRNRLKKGEAIIRGPGFEMQGEDYPASNKISNTEFVTDAFDETVPGLAALKAAMTGIQGIVTAMNTHAVAGQPLAVTALPHTKVIPQATLENAHQLITAKPQVTIGVKLEKLSDLMEDLFHQGATDDPTLSARRTLGRQKLGANAPGKISRIVGGAPGKAQAAIQAMQGPPHNAPAGTPALKSLLALVIAYLERGADHYTDMVTNQVMPEISSYAKTIAPIMARTDFAAMFDSLSATEKTYYSANQGQKWLDLVRQVPGFNNLDLPVYQYGVRVQDPSAPSGWKVDNTMKALSRKKWLQGLARQPQGVDYLTSLKFPTRKGRSEIEGLGAYGKKMDTFSTGGPAAKKMPILELRSLPTNVAATDWKPLAENVFNYILSLNVNTGRKYGE